MVTMHRGRSISGVRRGGGPRRATEWIAAQGTISDVAESTARVRLQFTQAQLVDLVPFTITRTIATWFVAFDADFITNQTFFAALGGMVVREPARAAGIASLPSPLAEMSDDGWFLHNVQMGFLEETLTSNAALVTGLTHLIDNRAQRKVEDGDAIVFTEETLSGDGIQTGLALRILCKLH